MVDADKRELLAERAESLLISLKQRFPGLPQTSLDMSKIQYNKVPTLSESKFSSDLGLRFFLSSYLINWSTLICVGCWEVHLGELFKGFGEPGI